MITKSDKNSFFAITIEIHDKFDVLELKREWIVKCLNCGHDAHDGPLWRTELDYDYKEYQIEVCKHCRYDVDA